MLVFNDVDKLDVRFAELLADFRRVQISRFPVVVQAINSENMSFFDSRFPSQTNSSLGSVYMDGDKFIVESRLIQNEKYNTHNAEFRTRKTQDLKKVFKYMREYIKPYSSQEIAYRTIGRAREAFDDHKEKYVSDVRKLYAISADTLHTELMHMKMLGYEPKTDGFKKALDAGLPVMEENKRLQKMEFPRVHVYFAPDESVTVAVLAKHLNMEIGATTYESLETSPTFIQQQVGMLRMMDKNTHVPDVGYKSSDKEFWIEGFSQ